MEGQITLSTAKLVNSQAMLNISQLVPLGEIGKCILTWIVRSILIF